MINRLKTERKGKKRRGRWRFSVEIRNREGKKDRETGKESDNLR